MDDDGIIWTIEELYQWACENKIENYTVFVSDEGIPCNIYKCETVIDKKEEIIQL